MAVFLRQIDDYVLDRLSALAARVQAWTARVEAEPEKLRTVLVEELIRVYDRAAVERYMDKKGQWAWFPVRAVLDEDPMALARLTPTRYQSLYGPLRIARYAAPIPFPVLQTMERIQEKLGSEVRFFVAALDKSPDPFLAAVCGQEVYVIERWDEPGFRG